MKILGLALFFLMFANFVFANVSAKIISIDVGEKDYIWIKVEYNISGKKVINSYPMDFKNTVNKTFAEISEWIKTNIEYQCDRYIEGEFRKKQNLFLIDDKLKTLVGKDYIKETSDLKFDTNSDNIIDYQIRIKDDGTYTEISNP